MEEKVDIVALGELLIDFTEAGHSQGGRKLFEQNPGGAPAASVFKVSRTFPLLSRSSNSTPFSGSPDDLSVLLRITFPLAVSSFIATFWISPVVLFFYRLNKKRYNEIVEELKNGRKS